MGYRPLTLTSKTMDSGSQQQQKARDLNGRRCRGRNTSQDDAMCIQCGTILTQTTGRMNQLQPGVMVRPPPEQCWHRG